SNIPLAHAAGVQGEDLVLHAFGIAVILSNDFRLVIALAISGDLDVNFAQLSLDSLLRIPVAVIGSSGVPDYSLAAFSPQFLIHFHFHHLLDHIPEHLFHGSHDLGGAGKVLALHVLLQ